MTAARRLVPRLAATVAIIRTNGASLEVQALKRGQPFRVTSCTPTALISLKRAMYSRPARKLTESDEGELEFSIAAHDGRVVLNWGKPVQWIGVQPAQSRTIAVSLFRTAEEAEQKASPFTRRTERR